MVRIHWGSVALLAAALVLLSTAALVSRVAAKAHTVEFSSALALDGIDLDSRPGRDIVYGHIASERKACLANRTVKISYSTDGEDSYRLGDTSTTSSNGDWVGDIPPFRSAKFTLAKSKFGSRKHPKTCSSDRLIVD